MQIIIDMSIDTCFLGIYSFVDTTSWVFPDVDVGTHGKNRRREFRTKECILFAIILCNFVYLDSMHTEGCVHVKVLSTHNALFSS
jgi:hypothetical protein